MRIAEVKTHVLEAKLSEPFSSSLYTYTARQACIVEIVCEDGTTGWGECLGPTRPNAAVVATLRPYLLGTDPLETERIWAQLFNRFRDQGQKGLIITALSGIDVALWDIKGKRFGVPVYRLMGGPLRTEVRAYATGTYRRTAGDPLQYITEEIRAYVHEGFGAIKIKIGMSVAEDVALIRACREAVGPSVGLMLDANHGYDAVEAIALGRAVASCDIGWFEEPVVPDDLGSYREVRRGQPIPVAGGETWFTRWNFRDVMTARAVDIVQPDVCGTGGLSEAKKIADMAAAFGIRCVPHVWGTGIGLAAALQFLAVLPHGATRRTPAEPLLEFDRTEHPFRQAIIAEPIEHAGGVVRIPDGPGLGISIDRTALERFQSRPT